MPDGRFAVEIRRALPGDLPALLRMIEALTRHHDDVPRVTLETLARDVVGPAPCFQVRMAETEAGLVGYAACLPIARLGHGERGLDLHHLFVAETARGQGIGTALLRACEALARDTGCSYVIIGTHPDNRAAQVYYQSLGYEQMPNTAVRFTRWLDRDGQA